MSIWGKITDVAGAFLRVLTGPAEADANITFTIAVIALSAKMAKADGIVTDDEIEAFERLFRVHPDEAANVRRVFDMARRDTAGYET